MIAQSKQFTHIFRFTGDNPILDIEIAAHVLKVHLDNDNDYTSSKGLPLGMNIEIARASCIIESSNQKDLTSADYEHVTWFLKRHQKFRKQVVEFNSNLKLKRFTVDHVEDYALLSLIFSFLDVQKSGSINQNLEHLFALHPWLSFLNDKVEQKRVFNNKEEELRHALALLKRLDLGESASILTRHIL